MTSGLSFPPHTRNAPLIICRLAKEKKNKPTKDVDSAQGSGKALG